MGSKTDQMSPAHHFDKIKQLTNAANTPLVEKNPINFLVNIKAKSDVPRALFIPDKLNPGQYFAHPITIRAMRKDIFVVSDDFIDLEYLVECRSCREIIDAQFWEFCPHCESSYDLKKDKFEKK